MSAPVKPHNEALSPVRERFGQILAPVTGAERDKIVVETALGLATLFHAHAKCLFIHPDARTAIPFTEMPLSPGIVDEIVALSRAGISQARKAVHKTIEDAAATAGVLRVDLPGRAEIATVSLREVAGAFPAAVSRAAALSDLVVFGPPSATEWPDIRQGFFDALLRTGRPILITNAVAKSFSRKIAIAWDGSMPATRAITAAIPFLKRTDRILVLTIASGSEPARFEEVETYLAAHGFSCECKTAERGKQSIGEALLANAKAEGADMLVMGAYGHSHAREMVLGGASQYAALNASIPILMVH
jgi:nucleotide-binding universal stress UspA family protein